MCCRIKGNNKKINMKKEKMCEPLKSRNIVNYFIIISFSASYINAYFFLYIFIDIKCLSFKRENCRV